MSDWMILPSDEDIEHGRFHKYIDKIRTKTGKWRYIYERNNKLRRRVKSNKAMQEKMKSNINRLQNQESRIHSNQSLTANPFHGDANKDKKKLDTLDSELRQTLKEKAASIETYENFVNDIKATEKEYLNTPLGKAEAAIPGLSKLLDYIDARIRESEIDRPTSHYTPNYVTKSAPKPTTATRGTPYTPSYTTNRDRRRPNGGKSSYGRNSLNRR